MGKAARWWRRMTVCLFGMKKDKENVGTHSNNSEKEKKRWSFAKSARESSGTVGQILVTHLALERSSCVLEKEKLQKEHANAVPAATADAADAAMAVAEAALAVARLISQGAGGATISEDREKYAATKIQKVFRGYLARKALRALKGLVKVQALFRGYLVRKQIAATCMQALIRAEAAAIGSQRACRSINNENPVTRFTTFCSDTLVRPPYSRYPNYMADTESFKAKLRPRISPKQRLESEKKNLPSLVEKMASRSSFSGVGMQTSYN